MKLFLIDTGSARRNVIKMGLTNVINLLVSYIILYGKIIIIWKKDILNKICYL
jgi:hypothetical protein